MNFAPKAKYNIDDLLNIVSILRSDEGCPWDRKQDHKTIRKNFIEETYEVIEAIDLSDVELLKEELGDVLLQVVFHSQIEKEESHFEFDDVVDGLCQKLVQRHPHVFSDAHAENSDQALENWNSVKMKLKGQKSQSEAMESVSKALPSLMRSFKIQKKAARANFDFADAKEALAKVKEETAELWENMPDKFSAGYEEEIGDLLFSVVSVSRHLDIDPEEALYKCCDKFIKRYTDMEVLADKRSMDMSSLSIDELNALWEEVKNS